MRIKEFHTALRIANKISNQSSLTPLYRSVEIGVDTVRSCSEFGNIKIKVNPTGLNKPCLVNTVSLLAVVSSLPEDLEINMTELEGKIQWNCAGAKGHLNMVQCSHEIPELKHAAFPWLVEDILLPDALRLAACSCQSAAVSVGLYGITIEADGDRLKLLSCNSSSLAVTTVKKGTYPSGKITLRPPVPGIIATLIESCTQCALDADENGIHFFGDWIVAQLPLAIPLEHDLADVAKKFEGAAQIAKIDSATLKKFITRARALSDRYNTFTVGLRVEAGKLILEHQGMASSTEEYFLAEGLDTAISYKSVTLPADSLLLPLEHVDQVALDFLPDQRLVLKGVNPDFMFVVSGDA